MKHASHIVRYVLVAVLLALASPLLASCTSTGGVRSAAIVFSFQAVDGSGDVIALGRSDLNTTIIFGQGSLSAEVFQKPSATMPGGFPIYGPIETTSGIVFVHDRERNVRLALQAGAPLPAFTKILFRAGEAELLGLRFEDPTQ